MIAGRALLAVPALAALLLGAPTMGGGPAPAARVALVPAAASASPAPDPGTPAPVPSGTVQYYVVGPPINGQQEYLFAIAVRTLGDGNRALEIFNLNRGRQQADGDALTDPSVLHPGWVLVLPPDATGPGVLTGPLPTAPPVAAVNGTVSPAGPAPSGDGSSSLPRLLGPGVIAAILVLAVTLLRRRIRSRSPVPVPVPAAEPVPAAVLVGAPGRAAVPNPAAAPMPVPMPVPANRAAAPTSAGRDGPPPDAGRPTGPSTVDPHGMVLQADVIDVASGAVVTVRLVGSRTPQHTPAWLWLDPDATSPGPTYVALGTNRQGALCIDLNQAPDVLSVTGDPAAGQRLAVRLVEQLIRNRVPVTVVGSSLGGRVPGAHMVRDLADAERATDEPTSPQVIVATPGPEDQVIIRRLTGRSIPRTVPVLVHEGRSGRWWIQVAPAGDRT